MDLVARRSLSSLAYSAHLVVLSHLVVTQWIFMSREDVLFTAVMPLNYKTSRTTKNILTLFRIHEMHGS